jgi:hypothetical protein
LELSLQSLLDPGHFCQGLFVLERLELGEDIHIQNDVGANHQSGTQNQEDQNYLRP